MSTDWLVLAYQLDNKGGAKPLNQQDIQKPINDPYWVHMDINHPQSEQWLREHSGLDNVCISALTAPNTRPRAVEHHPGLIAILRGVNLNEDADPEDMVSIRVYIDENRIISTRLYKLKAVGDTEQELLSGKGPTSTGDILATLATKLCDRMESTINRINEVIDDLEEAVIETPDQKLRHQIIGIRKTSILLRRHLSPQRDALFKLRSYEAPWLSKEDKHLFQESYDRVTRYVEDLDTARERAQVVQDELSTLLTDRLNRNMYILSVVAAIFLPLGFLTGLLGINVGGIPGSEDGFAFWKFSILLTLIIGVQIFYFKRKGWF